MNLPVQDWAIRLERKLANMREDWGTTKSAVLDQNAVVNARLDRIEEKLDQVLAELCRRRSVE